MTRLERMLAGTPYAGYAYAYPHKSAYRTLEPPVPLRQAWAGEPRAALFLYLHVPFCEMRCGFCNLFTTANPPEELVPRYLEALEREALEVREAIGPGRIARLAIGGGTPTYLGPAELHRLFDLADQYTRRSRSASGCWRSGASPASASASRAWSRRRWRRRDGRSSPVK
jgi:oxygen-independent coproporphyrinogen III oxidase